MLLFSTTLRHIGRFCFRLSRKVETFADFPHFTIGNVYFCLAPVWGFKIEGISEDGIPYFVFGPVEIIVV
jgi:hypothetical protein